ncbi:Short integuments 2, mitochondrial [Ananas comosus]|uniref:Short integuments 2, mitochondrial n=1 Tax=Ananas comosus TaxID=4615 RepID=A0A199UQT6_ANACO|nr:Short integuments 2, mitochondrial [Ananas comosus]
MAVGGGLSSKWRAGKRVAEMGFNAGGGAVNWFPGHMAAAARAIRHRLKLADLVIEVRDARIPLSSANGELQCLLASKRRVIALNKKDLANPNIMHLLALVELKLKEVISREPTLLVMVVGVPNVGKSALINSIHRIATSRFPVQEKVKRATVGPLPGVTQDIAGYKIANQPSIYVLDTPGVLVPSIPDMETGLKLALTGAVKDSVVGEERLAQYLLAILNSRKTPLHWERLVNVRTERSGHESHDSNEPIFSNSLPRRRRQLDNSDVLYIEDLAKEVQKTLYLTFKDFEGNKEEESELESLIDMQLMALRKAFRILHKASDEARTMVSKKLLTLFRIGKLGPFILDSIPNSP